MRDLMESVSVNKDAHKVDLNEVEMIKIIRRRFVEEFLYYKDCTIVLINCLDMGDPHHDKDLRTHKGTHPTTLKGVSENMNERELKNVAAAFRTWLYRADGSDLL
eukprot:2728846-Karenia_brevis.AAC.1